MPEQRPKTAAEKAMDALQGAVNAALCNTSEVESVAVVISWRGDRRDLPAGAIVAPNGEGIDATGLLRLLEQLTRMAGFAVAKLNELIEKQRGVVAEVDRMLNERQAEIGRLQALEAARPSDPGPGRAGPE